MRLPRLVVCLPLLIVGFSMFAHADVGVDGGLADVNLPDVVPTDGAASDASTSDGSATTDASSSDGGTTSDASSNDAGTKTDAAGQCCPSLPCTCPADGGNPTGDAGDNEGAGSGGCSCDSSPLDAGTASPLLLVALATLARRRKRA